MKGRVLDFSIQTNSGVISADDGSRYSFTGDNWNLATPPRTGTRVDFNPVDGVATGIYTDTGVSAIGSPAAAPSVPRQGIVAEPAPAAQSAPSARRGSSSLGVFGMIIGLPALILFWVPILGWLLMVVGLGLSVAGLVKAKRQNSPSGFAIAGVTLNSLTLGIRTFIAMVATIYSDILSKIVKIALEDIFGDFLPFLSFFL